MNDFSEIKSIGVAVSWWLRLVMIHALVCPVIEHVLKSRETRLVAGGGSRKSPSITVC